jgi:hypothetical protein
VGNPGQVRDAGRRWPRRRVHGGGSWISVSREVVSGCLAAVLIIAERDRNVKQIVQAMVGLSDLDDISNPDSEAFDALPAPC